MKMRAPPAGGAKKDGREEGLLAGALFVIMCVRMYVCVCTESHLPSMPAIDFLLMVGSLPETQRRRQEALRSLSVPP